MDEDVWGECIEFTGTIDETTGYGKIYGKGAHRVAYEKYVGKIPEGHVVMHTCDNKTCVNPHHLKVGTQAENRKDCFYKDRHAKGESIGAGKLTEQDVREIRKELKNRRYRGALTEIAEKYGVTIGAICKIRDGKSWNHIK